jgi:hypothetical protein
MTITTRFGTKLNVPSTFQIKHQLLLFWLKNQIAKEAAEAKQMRVSLAGDERLPRGRDRLARNTFRLRKLRLTTKSSSLNCNDERRPTGSGWLVGT